MSCSWLLLLLPPLLLLLVVVAPAVVCLYNTQVQQLRRAVAGAHTCAICLRFPALVQADVARVLICPDFLSFQLSPHSPPSGRTWPNSS
jgi:hypothetical protein